MKAKSRISFRVRRIQTQWMVPLGKEVSVADMVMEPWHPVELHLDPAASKKSRAMGLLSALFPVWLLGTISCTSIDIKLRPNKFVPLSKLTEIIMDVAGRMTGKSWEALTDDDVQALLYYAAFTPIRSEKSHRRRDMLALKGRFEETGEINVHLANKVMFATFRKTMNSMYSNRCKSLLRFKGFCPTKETFEKMAKRWTSRRVRACLEALRLPA